MNMRLTKFLDRLGEEVAVLKLLVGNARKQTTEAIFIVEPHEPRLKATGDMMPESVSLDEAEDIILQEAENLGWGEDHSHIRINAKSVEGLHLKSLTLTKTISARPGMESNGIPMGMGQAFQYMGQVVDRSNKALIEGMQMLSYSLDHERNLNAEMMDNMMRNRRELAEAETAVMAMDLALSEESQESRSAVTKEALDQLGGIAKTIMQAKNPQKPTRSQILDQIRSYMTDDPDLIQAAMNDPSISTQILQVIMGDQNGDPSAD